jgi:hypothetical protein
MNNRQITTKHRIKSFSSLLALGEQEPTKMKSNNSSGNLFRFVMICFICSIVVHVRLHSE